MLTIIIKNNLLTQYRQHRLLINCAILAAMFLVNCFWGDMAYLCYAFLLLLVCADDLANGGSYLFFCVPFFFLKVPISIGLYFACILVFVVKFYIVRYAVKKHKPSWLLLSLIGVFLVYSLLPIGAYNLNLFTKVSALLIAFAFLGIICQEPAVLRLRFNARVVSIALIIASVFSFLSFLSPYLQHYFNTYHIAGDYDRFKALFVQPNNLAMVCEIVAAIFAYAIISKRANWVDYVLLLIITLLGLLTFSKTYLILICVIYLAILIYFWRQDFFRTTFVLAMIALVVVCLATLKPQIIGVYFGRFMGKLASCQNFTEFMNMVTTNRYNLWTVYLGFIFTHPLTIFFGQGLGAAALHGWSTLSAHNFLIAMIYQLGLVGTGLFIAIVALMIRESLRTRKQPIHKAICVPLIILALLLCVEDFILYIF